MAVSLALRRELVRRAVLMADAHAMEKALQRVRDSKGALDEAEAGVRAAHQAWCAAAGKLEEANRERLSAENALLTLVNGEPRALVEAES